MTIGQDGEEVEVRIATLESLAGFRFGASAIALFAHVAGGIFTKADDAGADLDPINSAVIAGNVGENFGDVAGIGADFFEPFVGSIITAVTLANGDVVKISLSFLITGAGIVASMIGFFFVRFDDGARQKQLLLALQKGTLVASFIVISISTAICTMFFVNEAEEWKIFGCIVISLALGVLISQATEYFTSYEYWGVKSVTSTGITCPAAVIIQSIGICMVSCVAPVLVLVATILSCNALNSQYGIAIAAVGILSTLGITLATDAYGTIADNAGGIAEMADL